MPKGYEMLYSYEGKALKQSGGYGGGKKRGSKKKSGKSKRRSNRSY